MHVQPKSCQATGLDQIWEMPFFCQYGAQRYQNGQVRARRALTSHLSHNLTVYDKCTCYAWLELALGRVCGRQGKLATFGGFNGGDDQQLVQVKALMVHCTVFQCPKAAAVADRFDVALALLLAAGPEGVQLMLNATNKYGQTAL